MASPETFDAFEGRLTSAWTTTPLVFENDHYDLPDTPAPFVYVEIYGDHFDQDTFGAPQHNMFLEEGATYLHVMIPCLTGSRDGRVKAEALLNLFREQPIGELFMPKMSIGAGAPGRDFPNYWALTATIEWYRHDITNLPTP